MGKTTFAMNLAINSARADASVALISADMSASQIGIRLLAREASIDVKQLLRSNLSMTEWQKLSEATHAMAGLNLVVDDSLENMTDLQQFCDRLTKRDHGLDMIVVDDLQSLAERPGWKVSSDGVGGIVRSLKLLAKELDVAIVVTSHLKPSLELRADKRPLIPYRLTMSSTVRTMHKSP